MLKGYSFFLRQRMVPLFMVFFLASGIVKCQGTIDTNKWYVSNQGNDSSECHSPAKPCLKIATAIQRAKDGDVIFVANGTYPENLLIYKDLSMYGEDMAQTIIDGGQKGPVLYLDGSNHSPGINFDLSNATLQNGNAENGGGLDVTGGIDVTLTNVRVADNYASLGGGIYVKSVKWMVLDTVEVVNNNTNVDGGGIYFIDQQGDQNSKLDIFGSTIRGNNANNAGGGIFSRGALSVKNTLIENNWAKNSSGGGIVTLHTASIVHTSIINNHSQYSGGGIYNGESGTNSTILISDSTIDGNISRFGGGIINKYGEVSLVNSTVSNNQATEEGAGILCLGWFTLSDVSRIHLINSTISGNISPVGAGIDFAGELEGINLTIAYNEGGGIRATSNIWTFSLINSLLAYNQGGNCNISVKGSFTTNLSDDPTCSGFIVADPLIGPLASNGGPTMTHALLPGSPAIDAGSDVLGLKTDQRGSLRPFDGDGNGVAKIDIGAYEFDQKPIPSVTPILHLVNTPTATATSTSTATATGKIFFTPLQNPNCRLGPDQVFSSIGVAMRDQVYPILGRNDKNDWLFIHLSDKIDCWVLLRFGSASGDVSLVPLLASPPTPTPIAPSASCVVSPSHPTCP
jgi:hypothetical protein